MTIGFAKYSNAESVATYSAFLKSKPWDASELYRAFQAIVDCGNGIVDIPESKMPIVVAALRLQGFEISGRKA